MNDEQQAADIQRTLSENRKLLEESFKLHSERRHIDKKIRWFEATLGISVFALGIAFAKLFLT